jgi:hypothetical protein
MAELDPDAPWREIARHGRSLATVRAFAQAAGAANATVVIDSGEEHPPVVVEYEQDGDLTISSGEETFLIPDEALGGMPPRAFTEPPRIPASALVVDVADGRVEAPLGSFGALVEAVQGLARVLGGRSVATVEIATRSGEGLMIAAREGEPVVLVLGDVQFTL